MSILGNILGGIFNHKKDAPAAAPAPAPAPAAPTAAPVQPPITTAAATAPQPAEPVDVAGILDFKNSVRDEKLNWRTSIVDLLKLLDLDSSLDQRKKLADELGYTGDKSDSASMNIWLHKQVIQKINDNGGQLPTDLTD
jgi:3-oxoacyl-ACP reductase-like protein